MTCARRFVLTTAVATLGLVPLTAAAQPAFEGVYIARGLDTEGHEYRRAVEIEREGDRFTVTWIEVRVVGQAIVLEPTWFGVGIATGGTLSVSVMAEDTFGIAVYEAASDGQELSGRWSLVDDEGVVYSETLTRLPDKLPEPAVAEPSADPRYQLLSRSSS
jgi:hypothetical protein